MKYFSPLILIVSFILTSCAPTTLTQEVAPTSFLTLTPSPTYTPTTTITPSPTVTVEPLPEGPIVMSPEYNYNGQIELAHPKETRDYILKGIIGVNAKYLRDLIDNTFANY